MQNLEVVKRWRNSLVTSIFLSSSFVILAPRLGFSSVFSM